MPKQRLATRDDHDQFCVREGWSVVSNSRGKAVSHHLTYELPLADGRTLRTRISRPPDRTTYGKSMWAHIMRDQLDVDAEAFWACVKQGALPDRGVAPERTDSIPTEVVFTLLKKVGLMPAEIGTMTKEQAMSRVGEYWSTGK